MIEKFLQIVKEPFSFAAENNKDWLKFFNSKFKTWHHSGLSYSNYQNVSPEDLCSLLKGYYNDMNLRFSFPGKFLHFSEIFALFWFQKIDSDANISDFFSLLCLEQMSLESSASSVLKR